MLWEAAAYTAVTTEVVVIEWAALFGVPKFLVMVWDHFVNQLVEALVTRFRNAHHHVTTPYAPWANGVIERVNREILRL